MKLPDFFKFETLNDLKEGMGLSRDATGDLVVRIDAPKLTELELAKLLSSDGLDIELNDLRILQDGTLAYKNSRVLLYIRDVSVFGGREPEPRFHLSNCSTLIDMKRKKRFDFRYVVATRTDGRFNLNYVNKDITEKRLKDLLVCQNCLDRLRFNGFQMTWEANDRKIAVKVFNLEDFFYLYPKSLHSESPKYNSDDAPINNYVDGFAKISNEVRSTANWRCQSCDLDLSEVAHRKYLHTHHKNGIKFDNNWNNLEALCLFCHAERPLHNHMKNTSEYKRFLTIRTELRRRG